LAKSGQVSSITLLRAQIKDEGYAINQIDGVALGRQLRSLIAKSNERPSSGG
jgi:hypothetical protein